MVIFHCNDIKLKIGFKIPAKYIEVNTDEKKSLYQTHSELFQPFLRKEIRNVWYVIGYDDESHQITYIHTSDLRFRTKEGLRVGSEIELRRDQVKIYPAWEIHGMPNKDGWNPVIGYNRPENKHETEIGDIVEPGDPTSGFQSSDTINIKIVSFTKTR